MFGEYVESRDSDVAAWIAIAKRNADSYGEPEIIGGTTYQKSPSELNINLAQHLAFAWEDAGPHPILKKNS